MIPRDQSAIDGKKKWERIRILKCFKKKEGNIYINAGPRPTDVYFKNKKLRRWVKNSE